MHSNVVVYPETPLLVSKTRARDKALALLLPKFFGVLWDRGRPGERSRSVKAFIGNDLELGGDEMQRGAYCISAYVLTSEWQATKVFSAHVGSRTVIDGVWPYWGGCCRILSWKRGPWEDRIVAERGFEACRDALPS